MRESWAEEVDEPNQLLTIAAGPPNYRMNQGRLAETRVSVAWGATQSIAMILDGERMTNEIVGKAWDRWKSNPLLDLRRYNTH